MKTATRGVRANVESAARTSACVAGKDRSPGPASPAPRADSSTPSSARSPAFAVRFPIRTVSELNRRGHEHYRVTHKRSSEQKWIVSLILGLKRNFRFPVTVKLTRLAPRKLDAGDNLNSFAKSIRDQIAKWLGVNDGDETRVTWEYAQEKSADYGVRMEIFES
jgi:hypothetical protein